MNIDILIAVAEKGGVENVIKMMVDTLESEQLHFRVIQMVWEGYHWLDQDVEYYPLLEGKAGHTLQEFISEYKEFLKEKKDIPDVILATGWPYLCQVAKMAHTDCGLDTKVISWMHCGVENYDRMGYGGIEQLMFADAHFAINQEIYLQLRKIPNTTVYRVNNPVEISDNYINDSEKEMSHELLFIGRISKEKNIGLILQALARTSRWKLTIVGDGEERNAMENLAIELDVEKRIEWKGWKEHPWEGIGDIDALVLSSYYEGFPLTVIEALGRGIPVISTKVSGVTELVEDGKNGYLYDINDVEKLVEILCFMEQGGMKKFDKKACQEKVLPYERKTAFGDMLIKIQAIYQEIRLRPNTSNHPWYAFQEKVPWEISEKS